MAHVLLAMCILQGLFMLTHADADEDERSCTLGCWSALDPQSKI